MTDEQTVAEIISEASYAGELSRERDAITLEAEILKALRAARQPTAHEVPGFHVTSSGEVVA